MSEMENREEKKSVINWDRVLAVAGGVVTVASLVCLGYSVHRERKLSRALSNAIKEVSDMTEVKVSEGIVNKGIELAVEREVNHIAKRAVDDISANITAETQKRVKSAVEQSYARLKEGVADAFAKEVAMVDKDDIMSDITEKAKELLVEKFDSKLDSLLADYNRNLDNVGKIYQSIAESMTDKKGKTVTLVS